jgi:hypothetical protein
LWRFLNIVLTKNINKYKSIFGNLNPFKWWKRVEIVRFLNIGYSSNFAGRSKASVGRLYICLL